MADPNLFFSVLNELARSAKQAMPLEQWQRYLAPGRVLERGGVKFPLRADEVRYGPLSQMGRFYPENNYSISPTEMASQLNEVSGYPEFQLRRPSTEVSDARGTGRDSAQMAYQNQYQLPGPKLGQAEELTVLPGSDFVPSTSHFGGQPGLVSWSRVTRRPVIAPQQEGAGYRVEHPLDPSNAQNFATRDAAIKYAQEHYPDEMKDPALARDMIKETQGQVNAGYPTATHLEEIQSDWHQRAREEGYTTPRPATPEEREAAYEAGDTPPMTKGVPPAPYKDTYAELELKKGIARALAQGDDYVTWTTGDQQADRWGQALRNSVDELHWTKKPDGTYDLVPYKNGNVAGVDERLKNLTPDQLHDTVGSDIAKRITGGEGALGPLSPEEQDRRQYLNEKLVAVGGYENLSTSERRLLDHLSDRNDYASMPGSHGVVSGQNLTVGGAGMRLFYDRKVKEAAERLAKQYGGEVTRVNIAGGPGQLGMTQNNVMEQLTNTPVEMMPEARLHNLTRELPQEGNVDLQGRIADLHYVHNNYHEMLAEGADEEDLMNEEHHYGGALTRLEEGLKEASSAGRSQEVHALRLTPQMKANVQRAGLPLFSAAPLAIGLGAGAYEGFAPEQAGAVEPQPQGYASGGLVKALVKKLVGAVEETEPGFVYHATNIDRANEIAESGLRLHKPWEYFTPTPQNTWQFAPEEGHPVLLRVPKDNHPFKREGTTGDIYSNKVVPPDIIQYLGADGSWQPLKRNEPSLPEPPPPVPDHLAAGGLPGAHDYASGGLIENLGRIIASAIKDDTGQVWRGLSHDDAAMSIIRHRLETGTSPNTPDFEDQLFNQIDRMQHGFVTDQGVFLTREDALRHLMPESTPGDELHSGDIMDQLRSLPRKYARGGLPTLLQPRFYAYQAPGAPPLGTLGGLPAPALPAPLTAFGLDQLRPRRNRAPVAPRVNLHPGEPETAPAPDYQKLLATPTDTGSAPAVKPVDYGGGAGNPGLAAAPPATSGGLPGAVDPSQATGVGGTPGGYLAALEGAEGGTDPTAPVAHSTALGPYRFTDQTWADVARVHPELNLTPEGRTDPTEARAAALALTKDHAQALAGLGEPVTDTNLRMLHFLGQGDGLRLLYATQAAPDDPATAHVSPAAAAANYDVFYDKKTGQPRTVGEVYTRLGRGFGGSTFAGQYLTPAPPLPGEG